MQKLNHCLFYDEKNELPGSCGCRYKIQTTKIKKLLIWISHNENTLNSLKASCLVLACPNQGNKNLLKVIQCLIFKVFLCNFDVYEGYNTGSRKK